MIEKEFIDSLSKLFDRDLNKLEQEISFYGSESSLWQIRGEIKNSAGNLALHLCGNLQHYIGHVLGKSDYKRNRDNEFAAKNIPKEKLLDEIRRTRAKVNETLKSIDAKILEQEYPSPVFEYKMTTLYFLIHLQGHLNYHLGQVNYHRRLIGY